MDKENNYQEISLINSQMSKLQMSAQINNSMREQHTLIVNNSASQECKLSSQSGTYQDEDSRLMAKLYQCGLKYIHDNSKLLIKANITSQKCQQKNASNKNHNQQKCENAEIHKKTLVILLYSNQQKQKQNIQENKKRLQNIEQNSNNKEKFIRNRNELNQQQMLNFTQQIDKKINKTQNQKIFYQSNIYQQDYSSSELNDICPKNYELNQSNDYAYLVDSISNLNQGNESIQKQINELKQQIKIIKQENQSLKSINKTQIQQKFNTEDKIRELLQILKQDKISNSKSQNVLDFPQKINKNNSCIQNQIILYELNVKQDYQQSKSYKIQSNNKTPNNFEHNESQKIRIYSDDTFQKTLQKESNQNEQKTIQIVQKNHKIQKTLKSEDQTILNSKNDFTQRFRIQYGKYHLLQREKYSFQRQLTQFIQLDLNSLKMLLLQKNRNIDSQQDEQQLRHKTLQQILNDSIQLQQQTFFQQKNQLNDKIIQIFNKKKSNLMKMDKDQIKNIYQQLIKIYQKQFLSERNKDDWKLIKVSILDIYGGLLYIKGYDDEAFQIFNQTIEIKLQLLSIYKSFFQYLDNSKFQELIYNNQTMLNGYFKPQDFLQYYQLTNLTIIENDGKMTIVKINYLQSIFVKLNLMGKNNYAIQYYGQKSLEYAKILIRTAIWQLFADKFADSLSHFQQSLKIQYCQGIYQSIDVAIILQHLGQIYNKYYSNHAQSLKNYLKSMEILKILGYQDHYLIQRYRNIGKLYLKQSNFSLQQARKYLQKALQIANKFMDQKSFLIRTIYQDLFHLCRIYLNNFQYDNAFYYGKKSYKYYKKVYGQNNICTVMSKNICCSLKYIFQNKFQF